MNYETFMEAISARRMAQIAAKGDQNKLNAMDRLMKADKLQPERPMPKLPTTNPAEKALANRAKAVAKRQRALPAAGQTSKGPDPYAAMPMANKTGLNANAQKAGQLVRQRAEFARKRAEARQSRRPGFGGGAEQPRGTGYRNVGVGQRERPASGVGMRQGLLPSSEMLRDRKRADYKGPESQSVRRKKEEDRRKEQAFKDRISYAEKTPGFMGGVKKALGGDKFMNIRDKDGKIDPEKLKKRREAQSQFGQKLVKGTGNTVKNIAKTAAKGLVDKEKLPGSSRAGSVEGPRLGIYTGDD